MTKTIDVKDLPLPVAAAIAEAAASGAEILVTDGDVTRARVIPVAPAGPRTPGLHAGVIEPSDDFDAPLPDEFWAGRA